MKVGIIIIGSLLWDENRGKDLEYRKNWRHENLDLKNKIHCKLPVRYGRKSGKGKHYTMVYTKDINYLNYGLGYLIPIQTEIKDIDEIISHAKKLSLAEGKETKSTSKCPVVKGAKEQWAVISFIFNSKLPEDTKMKFRHEWNEKTNIKFLKIDKFNEFKESIINTDGEITSFWPESIKISEQEKVNEFDLILTTCTKINVSKYPSNGDLLKDINKDDREYFFKNLQNGIITFQDFSIVHNKKTAHNTG